jgi:hypothetical protein
MVGNPSPVYERRDRGHLLHHHGTPPLVPGDGARRDLDALHLIQFTEDHTVLAETSVSVVERDLLGTPLVHLLAAWTTTRASPRSVQTRGLYYVIYQESLGGGLDSDGFLVWDATGTEIADWRAAETFTIPAGEGGDWLHTNSIFVDEAGDVLLSLYGQNTLVKIEGDLASPTSVTRRGLCRGPPRSRRSPTSRSRSRSTGV